MIIINSLLMSKSFSLGEVRRTLSLFCDRSSTGCDRIDSRAECAQPGTVVGLIAAEHGKQSMQQFPHDRHNSCNRALPRASKSEIFQRTRLISSTIIVPNVTVVRPPVPE
jgi:hypothetical protein